MEIELVTDGVKGIDVAWLAPGRTELESGELVLRRAPEFDNAHAYAPVHPSNQCVQQEARESPGGCLLARRTL